MVDKRGWLRVVEASIGAILVLGALILVGVQQHSPKEEDLSVMLPLILDELAKNYTLHTKIANASLSSSPGITSLEQEVIVALAKHLGSKSLNYAVRICPPLNSCNLTLSSLKNRQVYVSERIISASPTKYEPKKIKLFVWKK